VPRVRGWVFVIQSLPARGEEEGTMVQGTATLSLILPPFMEAAPTSRDGSSSRMQCSAAQKKTDRCVPASRKRMPNRPACGMIHGNFLVGEYESGRRERWWRRSIGGGKAGGPVLPIERRGGTRPAEKERQRGEREWATPCLNPRESL